MAIIQCNTTHSQSYIRRRWRQWRPGHAVLCVWMWTHSTTHIRWYLIFNMAFSVKRSARRDSSTNRLQRDLHQYALIRLYVQLRIARVCVRIESDGESAREKKTR